MFCFCMFGCFFYMQLPPWLVWLEMDFTIHYTSWHRLHTGNCVSCLPALGRQRSAVFASAHWAQSLYVCNAEAHRLRAEKDAFFFPPQLSERNLSHHMVCKTSLLMTITAHLFHQMRVRRTNLCCFPGSCSHQKRANISLIFPCLWLMASWLFLHWDFKRK